MLGEKERVALENTNQFGVNSIAKAMKEASKYSPDNSGAGGSTPGGGNGEEENPLG